MSASRDAAWLLENHFPAPTSNRAARSYVSRLQGIMMQYRELTHSCTRLYMYLHMPCTCNPLISVLIVSQRYYIDSVFLPSRVSTLNIKGQSFNAKTTPAPLYPLTLSIYKFWEISSKHFKLLNGDPSGKFLKFALITSVPCSFLIKYSLFH